MKYMPARLDIRLFKNEPGFPNMIQTRLKLTESENDLAVCSNIDLRYNGEPDEFIVLEEIKTIAGEMQKKLFPQIKPRRSETERDRFAEAFDNIAWYNGHYEWLWKISDQMKTVSKGSFFQLYFPKEEWMTDKHTLWMMLVSEFGSWGSSIRSGWIENAQAAAAFIDKVTERNERAENEN